MTEEDKEFSLVSEITEFHSIRFYSPRPKAPPSRKAGLLGSATIYDGVFRVQR